MSKNMLTDFNYDEYRQNLERAQDMCIHIIHTFDEYDPFGGVTVAWRKTGDNPRAKMIEVSTAYCSDKDQFCKKIGTNNALNNFMAGATVLVPLGGNDNELINSKIRHMFFYSVF